MKFFLALNSGEFEKIKYRQSWAAFLIFFSTLWYTRLPYADKKEGGKGKHFFNPFNLVTAGKDMSHFPSMHDFW